MRKFGKLVALGGILSPRQEAEHEFLFLFLCFPYSVFGALGLKVTPAAPAVTLDAEWRLLCCVPARPPPLSSSALPSWPWFPKEVQSGSLRLCLHQLLQADRWLGGRAGGPGPSSNEQILMEPHLSLRVPGWKRQPPSQVRFRGESRS